MANVIEIRLCDEDRERLGGPEWIRLDVDRLFDTAASMLERWEDECGYSVERAAMQCIDPTPPARAVRVLVWLARKQGGDLAGGIDPDTGRPEAYARLADLRTMRVRMRDASTPEADVDPPPGESEPQTSTG